MFLSDDDFLFVISNTPLVAIDLILRDAEGRIFLGRRRNEPASGKWFVPGGRILKDESIEQAFARICRAELGQQLPYEQARLRGAYTHKYAENVFRVPAVTTHYVVLAYALNIDAPQLQAHAQHVETMWATPAQLTALGSYVHDNVLPYLSADERALMARESTLQ